MTVSPVSCPLCRGAAAASDIDSDMRARVYCDRCTVFDITRMAHDEIAAAPAEHLAALSDRARAAPAGELLVIARRLSGGATYEARESKADRPAPSWLPRRMTGCRREKVPGRSGPGRESVDHRSIGVPRQGGKRGGQLAQQQPTGSET